jgi:phosphate starvation-inducible membrane PsiE
VLIPFTNKIEEIGNHLIGYYHFGALFMLFGAVVFMTVNFFLEVINAGTMTLQDILEIFIYLEIGAMIGIYFKTHQLPVQYLIYIAITALTRVLTIDIKTMSNSHILTITGAVLILVTSATILNRYNSDESCN